MPHTSAVLIAVGANLPAAGTSVNETLRMATIILHRQPDITMIACSRFWKTPAMPEGSGPDFVNAALQVRTRMPADQLLEFLHMTEAQLGRDRSTGRWSARVLDLDLLAYDDQVLPDQAAHSHWMNMPAGQQAAVAPDQLILPHPRMQDRGFVLAPLSDIAPGWIHPVTGKSVMQMLDALPAPAKAGIRPYTSNKIPLLP